MNLGQAMKAGRWEKKMTQEDLAERIGKSRACIILIERSSKTQWSTAKKIATQLEISLDSLSL